MKVFTLGVLMTLCTFLTRAQQVQWSAALHTSTELKFATNDSTQQTESIFLMRRIAFDSLSAIAATSGTRFNERTYTAEFNTPAEVSHLVIPFRDATRLIYYIMLYDTRGESHLIYDFMSVSGCDPGIETLVLTIARTPYKVTRVEIGTFIQDQIFLKVGISAVPDVNSVIKELMTSVHQLNICTKTSFLADRELLSANINSTGEEVKPLISPDGKTLMFHRQNVADNIGGMKDPQDIYIADLQKDGQWSTARNAGAPLNDKMPNGVAAISPGGNTLFLINEYLGPNKQQQGLSLSERTVKGWSFPKKMNVDKFYNNSPYIDFYISPTQSEMILAIQRDDSYGDQDLYISFYDDTKNSWTEPANLGEQVNTTLGETAPYLAADGKTLYFASEGYLGYGGFDLYVTRRLDDSWKNWSTPENLGPVINGENNDLYYTVSAAGDRAYFVSTLNQSRDIYSIALPRIYKPEPVVLLSGKVFSGGSALPLDAVVKFMWHGERDVIGFEKVDPETGDYKLVLPAGGVYDYVAEKEGFQFSAGTISTLGLKAYEEKEQNLMMMPITSPAESMITVTVASEEAGVKRQLTQIAAFVKSFPYYKVTITGEVSDSLKAAGFTSLNELYHFMVLANAPAERMTVENKTGLQATLYLQPDASLKPHQENVIIPASYQKPTMVEQEEVQMMVKGKIVNGNTLKPVGGRIIFKDGEQVKSRTTSDPVYGKYQALLSGNRSYSIKLYQDEKEFSFQYSTPKINDYREVEHAWVTNLNEGKTGRVEVGSRFAYNMDIKEDMRWRKKLGKKKTTRELLLLQDTTVAIPARFSADLEHLAEIIKDYNDATLTLFIHTAAGTRDHEQLEQKLAGRCTNVLISNGLPKERIMLKLVGDAEPRNSKLKHHTNTRIEAQITFQSSPDLSLNR